MVKFVNINSGKEVSTVHSSKGFILFEENGGKEFTYEDIRAISIDVFSTPIWDSKKTGSVLVTFSDFTPDTANWISGFINLDNMYRYIVVRD